MSTKTPVEKRSIKDIDRFEFKGSTLRRQLREMGINSKQKQIIALGTMVWEAMECNPSQFNSELAKEMYNTAHEKWMGKPYIWNPELIKTYPSEKIYEIIQKNIDSGKLNLSCSLDDIRVKYPLADTYTEEDMRSIVNQIVVENKI